MSDRMAFALEVRTMKKFLMWGAAALFAVQPVSAAMQAQPAPAPATAPVAQTVQARPAIWMVKDADTTVYMLGTVHLLKPNIEWKTGPVKRAYDASQEVVLEMIPPDDAAMQQLTLSKGIDRDGPPLTQKLDAATRAKYEAAMQKFGLPVAQFEMMQPWLVATVLGVTQWVKEGFDPNSGVDKKIKDAATKDGKKLVGLETAEQQIGFLADMPEPLQLRFLSAGLDDMDQGKAMVDRMMAAWTEGKPDDLAKVMNEGMDKVPEVHKILLTDRNQRWAEWIDARMKQPGTVFMAVGAGHLAGKDSVQDYLAKKNMKAVRVVQ